jgi:3-methyladenine DNA glycosylase AlkD
VADLDPGPSGALCRTVRAELASAADPAQAKQMRAYLKSEMACHGVPTPQRRSLVNAALARHPLPDRPSWLAAIGALWREATHRDERHAAIDLLRHKRFRSWQGVDLLPLYEELIVTGAWWDFVDELASRHVGPLLAAHPDQLTEVMLSWSTDTDRWKRRTSVICQLQAKQHTDLALLTACIEANIADQDFFLRKGIGWALRQHAKTDPDWVLAFVAAHPGLSPLSRREAIRNVEREKATKSR